MENQNKNHLSYFHNTEKEDKNTTNKHKKQPHLAVGLMFSILIIISLCLGLRIIEDNLINRAQNKTFPNHLNPFHLTVAKAAEINNEAAFLVQSHKHVRIVPNKGFTFIVKFKNTGNKTWRKGHVYLKSLASGLKFRHEFWPDPYFPGSMSEDYIEPGREATFKFAIQSPPAYGNFSGTLVLADDNVMIKNGEILISMEVTSDPEKQSGTPAPATAPAKQTQPAAETTGTTETETTTTVIDTSAHPSTYTEKKFPTPAPAPTPSTPDTNNTTTDLSSPAQTSAGPLMRVGLFHSEQAWDIKNEKAWQLLDENNKLLMQVPANAIVSVDYNETNSNYTYTYNGETKASANYLKLNDISDGLWIITNYTDSPSWNTSINYNDFKGDLELRHNNSRDRTWLIEELPMEEYLRGISETSNGSPIEYLKTMTVAARTYAYYHYTKATKHAHEYYHVDAKYDQVYKGYTASIIWKDLKIAVEQTNGIVAMYEGRPIVAAYFSRSDGRTRSFEEVWGYHVPYLVSVPCPYNAGRELWGHGVGIDATDAYHRAYEENATYEQILKYYYTGISLEKVW